MLTCCPHCETTFRVTAATLRIAHGQVRCGRCHRRFDAIAELVDDGEEPQESAIAGETESAAAVVPAFEPVPDVEPRSLTDQDLARIFVDERDWRGRNEEPPAPSDDDQPLPDLREDTEEIVVEEQQELEEITLEGRRIEISGTFAALAEPDDDAIEDVGAAAVQRRGRPVTVVLGEDEDEELLPPLPPDEILLPEDFERDEGFELRFDRPPDEVEIRPADSRMTAPVAWQPDRPPPEVAAAELAGVTLPALRDADSDAFAPSTAARVAAPARTDGETDADLQEIAPAPTERRARPALYSLMSLALATLLLIQVVHHFRQDLVRHPRFGDLIGAAYTQLGMPLSPNWDPTGYEVQQWGIASLPGDTSTLRLRASVTNLAAFPQPYPLLRLTLEDLWGAEVGIRALEPVEYLPPGTAADRMMAPGQRSDAEVRIVDPGEDAVGFRIDVCVRSDAGLRCAGDAGDSVP